MLFFVGERAVPENVGALGRHGAAFEEAFQFVFEADLVVGNGPVADGLEREAHGG